MKALINLLVLFIALFMTVGLGSAGFFITVVVSIFSDGRKLSDDVAAYFYAIAIGIDQTGNVIMKDIFNVILIKRGAYQFGKVDETISSVLGKNLVAGTLRPVGKGVAWVLDKIQANHCVDSINNNV